MADVPDANPSETDARDERASSAAAGSRWLRVVPVLALLAAAGLALWLFSRTRAPGLQDLPTVLVLYFDNQTNTPDLDWLREGLADMLIADLSQSRKARVISRDQVEALVRRAGWKSHAPVRLEEALAMSSHARAQILLVGKFGKAGDEIRMTVQAHHAPDGTPTRTETAIAHRPDQVIAAMGELAGRLSRYVGSDAPAAASNEGPPPMTGNLEAYRAYSMGIQHVSLLELPEGVQLLQRAVKLDPQFAAAYAALGSAYSVSWGRVADGKPYLEKAASLSNRLSDRQRMYVGAWYALANQDYTEAIRSLRQLVAKYPDDAEAYCSLGRLLEGEGQYAEAIEMERRGTAVDPGDPLIHNFLARVYCRAGLFDQAVTESRRYVELTGGEPNAWDSVGTSYMWHGKYAEAEAAYREALKRKPDFDIALVHLAGVHYREGRYKQAIEEVQQYVSIAPADLDQARGNAWLAWLYLRRGDVAKSREVTEKQVRVAGPLAFVGRTMLALKAGNLAEARKIVETAGTVPERGNRGSDRYRPYLRGVVALAGGKSEEAVAEFQLALKQTEPVGFLDWFEDCLADAYLRLGRLDDAVAEYERVLGRNPNAALARYHLAEAYSRKGDKERARTEYQRFLETWKNADSDQPELRLARAAAWRVADHRGRSVAGASDVARIPGSRVP